MSAVIALKYHDSIQMLTDAAAYTADGTISAILEKTWRCESLPLAFSGRGDAHLVEILSKTFVGYAGEFETVDQVMAKIRGAIEVMQANRVHIDTSNRHFEIVVAGCSEENGFFISSFCTHDFNSFPAYELTDQGAMLIGAPDVDAAELQTLTLSVPVEDPRFLKECGGDLLSLMRRVTVGTVNMFKPDASDSGSVVGGNCQLTTITKEGVSFEILREWNDQIGEKINPYRSSPNVQPLHSRKDRRLSARADRYARKTA